MAQEGARQFVGPHLSERLRDAERRHVPLERADPQCDACSGALRERFDVLLAEQDGEGGSPHGAERDVSEFAGPDAGLHVE